MTDVFYRGLSRLVDLEQVPLKSALADKARAEDVRKTCLKRALLPQSAVEIRLIDFQRRQIESG
jgi:hypothetical protein